MVSTNRFHLHTKTSLRDKDYHFVDQNVKAYIEMCAPIFNIYKYLGPRLPDGTVGQITDISDPVLMENAKRVYSTNIYEIYGSCQLNNNEFTLLALGMAITSTEIISITFHYNTMIERLGRKFLPGDVIEATFLRDVDLLDNQSAYNRFYVVESSNRSKEGWDPHWQYHLWTVTLKPLIDAPEFKDIIDQIKKKDDDPGEVNNGSKNPSVYEKELEIMDALLEEAEDEVPFEKTDEHHLWVDLDNEGLICWYTNEPVLQGHDGVPMNHNPDEVDYGEYFPHNPKVGDYYLRIDYDPPRLFQYMEGNYWRIMEYDNRAKWTGCPRYLREMINNDETFINDEGELEESRQALRDTIKAKVSYKKPWDDKYDNKS